MTSEEKDAYGIKLETIHEVTNRHKVIEVTHDLHGQLQKNKNVTVPNELGFVSKN